MAMAMDDFRNYMKAERYCNYPGCADRSPARTVGQTERLTTVTVSSSPPGPRAPPDAPLGGLPPGDGGGHR